MVNDSCTRLLRLPLLVVALAVALTACGGSPNPPDPTGVVTVTGKITLPAGHGVDLASLTVSTPLGIYPVSAAGEFEADVFDGARTEVGVETGTGALLLLGVTQGDEVSVSIASTAEALMYYLVGGMWLPTAQQDTVRSLLHDLPAAAALETELTRLLQAGGNGLSDPDQAVIDSLDAVHAELLGDARISSQLAAARRTTGEGLLPAADGDNVIITPSATVQAGVEVIHDPAGTGVVGQNHFRRPARLLAYETGWEDAEGVLTENELPIEMSSVEVPATGQLEFFEALLDVVTADSPWSPVLSPKLSLPDHEGASRTHFTVVALGPSGTDSTWPIMDDARFDTYHGHWEQIENDKTVELFLDELLLPLVEVYGLGALAKYDAGKLADLRQRMRLIHDEHLAGLGILLRNRQKGLVDGLKYALMELVENKNLRTDLLGMIREALAESDYNKFVFEGAEKRLSSRASATGVAAAIEALLVSGDVAKIMLDLASAPAAVSWTVVTTPALFVLMPEEARVSKANGSVRFEVEPRGEAAGNYLHRWTTSGDHGSLSDLDDDGTVLTTSAPEIWYFHDDPAHIRATDVDTITLEVFSVAEGVTTVPGGAQPIATLTATVTGDDREIPAGITVLHGITDILPGVYEEQWPCVAMYFSFPAGGTTSYEVQLEGLSVPSGSEHQAYNNHALEGRTSYDVSFSENDVYPWVDGCKWRDQDGDVDLARPDDVRAFRDDSTYWIHLFSAIHDELWDDYGRPPLGEVVEHWYDWVDGASITVVPE